MTLDKETELGIKKLAGDIVSHYFDEAERWFQSKCDGEGFYRGPEYQKFDEHGCYRDLPTQSNYGPVGNRRARYLYSPNSEERRRGIFTMVDK